MSTRHHYAGSISPRKTFLSLLAEPMMGSKGCKSTAFTLPLCPGSLYSTLPVSACDTRTRPCHTVSPSCALWSSLPAISSRGREGDRQIGREHKERGGGEREGSKDMPSAEL